VKFSGESGLEGHNPARMFGTPPLDLRDSLIPASGFAPAIQSLAIPEVAFVSNQRIQVVRGIYKSRADLLFSDCIRDTDTVDQRRTTEDVNRRFPT
jgi:hypothetical protein